MLIFITNNLFYQDDVEVMTDAAWGLSRFADSHRPYRQILLDSGIVPRLIELIHHPHVMVVTPIVRTLGSILSGDEDETQALVDLNLVPALRLMLGSKNQTLQDHFIGSTGQQVDRILKEACWSLSNIAAGSERQIQSLIDGDVFPAAIEIIVNDFIPPDIKTEASWLVANAFNTSQTAQLRYLAENCLAGISRILHSGTAVVIASMAETIRGTLQATMNNNREVHDFLLDRMVSSGVVRELNFVIHQRRKERNCQTAVARCRTLISDYFKNMEEEEGDANDDEQDDGEEEEPGPEEGEWEDVIDDEEVEDDEEEEDAVVEDDSSSSSSDSGCEDN